MLSLVSVVNKPEVARTRLIASSARQNAAHEVILVDNQNGRFANASSALNWGARQATGNWIVFLHQDVALLSEDWLARVERGLENLPAAGWCGTVGRNQAGRWRGILRDRAMVFGDPIAEPVEVQTLDEVLLIHRNEGEGHVYFDEDVPGWHAYGVEACCRALGQGRHNYVVPVPIWHDSTSSNSRGLLQAHQYVWNKHRGAFRRIYTTCGVLPHAYGWSGSYKVSSFLRRAREWRYAHWLRLARNRPLFGSSPWVVLDALTEGEEEVDCLHRGAWFERIDGTGFVDRPRVARTIRHHYRGLDFGLAAAGCVVIAPDLASQVENLLHLPDTIRRLIVCLYLDEPHPDPSQWRDRIGRPFQCSLAMETDETRWVILEILR